MARKTNTANGPAAPTTRWLDDDERATWLAFVFGTRLFWDEVERDLQRDAHLPFGYYEILVMLSEAPEHTLRMSDLADATQSSRSRLSHAVARLERDGWVRREECPTDRRGANAVLTPAGFAALAEAAPAHVESVRRHLFDQLSSTQVEQLHDICETLLAHLLPIAGARGDHRASQFEDALAASDKLGHA
jgi:DNA-binding MarR family transcriptional regulator